MPADNPAEILPADSPAENLAADGPAENLAADSPAETPPADSRAAAYLPVLHLRGDSRAGASPPEENREDS